MRGIYQTELFLILECVFSEVMPIRDGCFNRVGKVSLSKKSLQNCTGGRDDLRKFDVAVLF